MVLNTRIYKSNSISTGGCRHSCYILDLARVERAYHPLVTHYLEMPVRVRRLLVEPFDARYQLVDLVHPVGISCILLF